MGDFSTSGDGGIITARLDDVAPADYSHSLASGNFFAMSSRGFKIPLSMHWVAVYAFALVSLFGVYLLSFSDIGYFRDDHTAVEGTPNVPAAQPPPATAPLNPALNSPNAPSTSTTPASDTNKGAGDHVETLDPPQPGQMIFAINTDIKEDLDYLNNELLSFPLLPQVSGQRAPVTWASVVGPSTSATPSMSQIDGQRTWSSSRMIRLASVVQPLVDNPSYFAVSANVVNNPALSWVHYHLGVFEPYWPEMKKPWTPSSESSWRASELPSYKGPADGPDGFKIDGSTPAPFPGHRWLPVRHKNKDEYEDPTKFPASTLTYDAHGPSLDNWATAAQLHYSFFQHLENNETSLYKFGIWDYHYARISINFIALRGGDIMDAYPFPHSDDEKFLTVEHSRKLGKHVVVAGDGLAVHYAFRPQRRAHDGHGITDTDILRRYTAYAKELVCPFPKREVKAPPLLRTEQNRRRKGPGRSR
ncbi:hypothetical protein CHGG_02318 [Chaetomium globosum CBS 148.51]|uniref:Uncharacterized protein n=1 Tax=Chaetomium globosum (strain ATCC 6205 / CBS 148.51 / DSM 1962 / NBRC 6347 / NRRL 1970) TaxID=306901 RepID=Q2HBT6_CHAGB|nr:uncharacterized protein CHGG_02318 [Chaetomium globosum CBS 148.51]EAQ90383.1 hypothetical protein CHGG_02318 [Chaetomium globosum CBS 148.51]